MFDVPQSATFFNVAALQWSPEILFEKHFQYRLNLPVRRVSGVISPCAIRLLLSINMSLLQQILRSRSSKLESCTTAAVCLTCMNLFVGIFVLILCVGVYTYEHASHFNAASCSSL